MSDTKESARRWSGYVCPDCRFVFRVPRDHDGQGIVCPNCRTVLKIPQAGDHPLPLVVPLAGAASPAPSPKGKGILRRRKKSKRSEDHAWETSASHGHHSRRREGRQMLWLSIAGAVLFMGLVTAVLVALLGGDDAVQPANQASQAAADETGKPAASTAGAGFHEGRFVQQAEPAAKAFLAAASIEDALPLVLHPALTEARMRRFYPDGKIERQRVSLFNAAGELKHVGPAVIAVVRTGNFEDKPMAFVQTADGLKIDWESWVGWSDMTWDEFLASRPTEPQVFRLNLSEVDYYNFGFTDDGKWQSYRLESPDGEHSVFGYAERESILNSRLRPEPGSKKRGPLTLALMFPKDIDARNQVIIDELVAEGWVLESEVSP